jgi:hypothetical protein
MLPDRQEGAAASGGNARGCEQSEGDGLRNHGPDTPESYRLWSKRRTRDTFKKGQIQA